jgi:hypothetical protein
MSTLKFNKWQSIDGVTRNAVLQVVSASTNTFLETTSTTFVDTPLTLSITPTSATSKILVLYNVNYIIVRSSSSGIAAFRLDRNGTPVYSPYTNNGTGNYATGGMSVTGGTSIVNYLMTPITYLDSPGTTNQLTYKLQGCLYENSNSGFLRINFASTSQSQTSTMTLMEIAQ